MSEELELKFAIRDPRVVRAWLDRVFPPTVEAWSRLRITDRYFDTADLALAAAGYGARLRRIGGTTLVTVKSDVDVADGRHRRLELEAPATRSLRPERWPPSEARTVVLHVTAGRRLLERFVVRQLRLERAIEVDGAQVAISIDDGTVEVGGAVVGALRQLEAELKHGGPVALEAVASMVAESGVAEPESRSKLVMAAAMAEGASAVAADEPFTEAGRKVMRRHLVRMLSRERATRDGDPIALKQMRVATRRLRATWRIFGDGFKRTEWRRLVADLRRLGRTLGEVRDLDVLLDSLPADVDLDALRAAWQAERGAAFARLIELLDSAGYRRLVNAQLDLVGRRGAGVARRTAGRTVADELGARLGDAYAKVLAAGATARAVDDEASWHALRIRARRLRYSLEDFAGVLDPKASSELIVRLVQLQDALGASNDIAVTAQRVEEWVRAAGESVGRAEAEAVRRFVDQRRRGALAARRAAADAWRAVAAETSKRYLDLALGAAARPR